MATLNISDLSVGDWVQDNYGDYIKVAGMWQGHDFNYRVDLLRNGAIGTCLPCNIRPIPITAEVLEKNGIERKQYTIDIDDVQEIEYDGYRHILYQDGVQYDIILVDSCGGYFDLEIESSHRDEDGDRILISSNLSLDYVEFVHQLQHALRLAGVEKEINL